VVTVEQALHLLLQVLQLLMLEAVAAQLEQELQVLVVQVEVAQQVVVVLELQELLI
jgi:hypothetical protein